MVTGVSGRLLSSAFIDTVLPTVPGITATPPDVDRALERLGELVDSATGPAASVRSIADTIAVPLLRALGLRVTERSDAPEEVRLWAGAAGPGVVPVVIRPWADDLETVRRTLVRRAITADARWCVVINGRLLRILDAQRTWSLHALDIEVAMLAHDAELRQVLARVSGA